jgi:hypothetical protein
MMYSGSGASSDGIEAHSIIIGRNSRGDGIDSAAGGVSQNFAPGRCFFDPDSSCFFAELRPPKIATFDNRGLVPIHRAVKLS